MYKQQYRPEDGVVYVKETYSQTHNGFPGRMYSANGCQGLVRAVRSNLLKETLDMDMVNGQPTELPRTQEKFCGSKSCGSRLIHPPKILSVGFAFIATSRCHISATGLSPGLRIMMAQRRRRVQGEDRNRACMAQQRRNRGKQGTWGFCSTRQPCAGVAPS